MPTQVAAPAAHTENNHHAKAETQSASGLALTIAAIVCSVLGAALLTVGVFVLKDPVPQPAAAESAPVEIVATPVPTQEPTPTPAAESETGEAGQPEETAAEEEPAQPEDGQTQPAEQPAEPAAGDSQAQPHSKPAPEKEEETSMVKLLVTLAGMALLLAGAVLGIVNSLLLRGRLAQANRTIADQQRRLQEDAEKLRDYDPAEKLRIVLESIPVLEQAPAAQSAPARDLRTPPAGAMGYASGAPEAQTVQNSYGYAQVPAQPFRQEPQDPAQAADQLFAKELAAGTTQAVRSLFSSSLFECATINIEVCLNSYRAGQDVPYCMQPVSKAVDSPFFTYQQGGAAAVAYPNPLAVEQKGVTWMQERQFILKAFHVKMYGQEVREEDLAGLGTLPIKKVQGALLDERMVVTRKGVIELGG